MIPTIINHERAILGPFVAILNLIHLAVCPTVFTCTMLEHLKLNTPSAWMLAITWGLSLDSTNLVIPERLFSFILDVGWLLA